MYRELIENLTKGNHWVKPQEPCSKKEIKKAEQYVGFDFPKELRELLEELNGDRYLFLSAKDIIETAKRNRKIIAEYLSPEEFEEKVNRFIYFATNGCGDYYCYRILPNGKADSTAIFVWEHELFEIREIAKDIPDLINKYYNNEI